MSASPPALAVSTPRLTGIDAGRFVAACGLPFMHVEHAGKLSELLDLACRFAVPFFFVTSGYFLAGRGGDPAKRIADTIKRLGAPFVVWTAVYFIASRQPLSTLGSPAAVFDLIVNGGPGFHLWFLPALVIGSAMVILLQRFGAGAMLGLGAALYATALVIGPYAGLLSLHIGDHQAFVRNGVMFGFPFMAVGFYLATTRPNYPGWLAVLIFAAGGVLNAAESIGLNSPDHAVRSDVLISTIPFGVGAFMLAMRLGSSAITEAMAKIGRLSLGMYALHLLGLWIAYTLFGFRSFVESVLCAMFALSFSIAATLLIAQIPHLRVLVGARPTAGRP